MSKNVFSELIRDVTILNRRFVIGNERKLEQGGFDLRYPTGEKVPIEIRECSGSIEEEVPMNLKELFAQNSSSLNETQKETFVNFLNEFQDIFSEDVVAGNCELIENEIKLKNCRPIKQAPCRIPIHMQGGQSN
ncbi:hypothetical protein P5V15_010161 [Pogonomyrmex californicus]